MSMSEKPTTEKALEATMGMGECLNIAGYRDEAGVYHEYARIFLCSVCGYKVDDIYSNADDTPWSHCPKCGRKVVDA